MTQRFFSRWRIARRRMNGSATARTSNAVMTRVWMSRFSSASCSASALMTVASIPMLSPVTRSMPCVAAETPRMMFPPPMTIGHLDAEARDLGDLVGDARDHRRLDAEGLAAEERLPGELQQDPAVAGLPRPSTSSARRLRRRGRRRLLLDALAHLEAHEADDARVLAGALGDDLGDLLRCRPSRTAGRRGRPRRTTCRSSPRPSSRRRPPACRRRPPWRAAISRSSASALAGDAVAVRVLRRERGDLHREVLRRASRRMPFVSTTTTVLSPGWA